MPTTPHPYVWFAKFANTRPQPELAVMRFANSAIGNKPREYQPPASATGFELINPDTNERLSFLVVAHLKPNVDPDRPVLQIATLGMSAFPQPDWPIVYGQIDDTDPMSGLYVSINTPAGTTLMWSEGSMLPDDLTVDDVTGGHA